MTKTAPSNPQELNNSLKTENQTEIISPNSLKRRNAIAASNSSDRDFRGKTLKSTDSNSEIGVKLSFDDSFQKDAKDESKKVSFSLKDKKDDEIDHNDFLSIESHNLRARSANFNKKMQEFQKFKLQHSSNKEKADEVKIRGEDLKEEITLLKNDISNFNDLLSEMRNAGDASPIKKNPALQRELNFIERIRNGLNEVKGNDKSKNDEFNLDKFVEYINKNYPENSLPSSSPLSALAFDKRRSNQNER